MRSLGLILDLHILEGGKAGVITVIKGWARISVKR